MQKPRFLALRSELKQSLFRPYGESPTLQTLEQKSHCSLTNIRESPIIFQSEIQDDPLSPQKSSSEVKIQVPQSVEQRSLFPEKKVAVHDNLEFSNVYEEGEDIGQGGHAIVKTCRKKNNQDESMYAVKIFRTGDPEIINTIKKTFQYNQRLVHPNVCQAYELFIDERSEQCYFVQEFCSWPSLEQILQKQKKLTFKQARMVVASILSTVQYLHSSGIAHRDIKPDNILVDIGVKTSSIKLIDFGVSKRFYYKKTNSSVGMWTRTGNIFYQAPESFQGGGYDEKVDIWSVGVVLYQLIVGKLPFESDQIMDTIELIQKAELDGKVLSTLPKLLGDLLNRIFRVSPTQRLSAKGQELEMDQIDCLMHPWLKQEFKDDDHRYNHAKDDGQLTSSMSPIHEPIDVSKSTMDHPNWTPDLKSTKKHILGFRFVYDLKFLDLSLMQPQGAIHHIEKDFVKKSRFRAFSLSTDRFDLSTENQSPSKTQWIIQSTIAESPVQQNDASNSVSPQFQ